MSKIYVDILIKNGQILTINSKMEIIEDGVVVIRDNEIVDIGSVELLNKYTATKVIDADGGIVMPGMVNTHNHLPMIAFRGLGEEGIEDRLMGYFMPLEKQMLTRELIYYATIHGAIDMALSGVTTYADMYYHVDEMAKATKEIGLRAVLGQTVIGFPVVDASKPYGGLDYYNAISKEYENDELITLALAPHATYSVSKEKLLEVKKLAKKMNSLIHIHVAEFKDEKNKIADNITKTSPIKYLNEIGFLSDNVILAHCNHTDEEDLAIIKKTEAKIAHNPMANAKGATGTARIVEALKLGIPVGLGTDGPMGSNVVDLFKVMTYASTTQRLRKMDETLMTPETIVRMATMGGATVLKMENCIGSLEVGKQADVIIVETKSMNMIPNYNPYATLVFQANPHNVDTTIINGKVVMEKRVLQSYDVEKNRLQMMKIFNHVKPLGEKLARNAKRKS